MKSRCNNPKVRSYADYGERGIKYIKRWEKFSNFLKDMGEAPTGLTLERLDNSRGYSKKNCKWATFKEQNRNRRNDRLLGGKTLTEWSEILGVKLPTLSARLYTYKWPLSRVLIKARKYNG